MYGPKCGNAGFRSRCLAHAKRALYQLSYAPAFLTVVKKCTTYIQSALAHPWDEGECTSSDKDSEARSTCDCMVAGSIPTQGKAIQPQLFLSWRQLQTNVGCDLEGSQAPQLLKFSSAMVSVPSTFESHLSEK